MTCIIGLVAETGDVYIGGDSAAMAGWDARRLYSPSTKVFRNGLFLFGCAGSFRYMQALRHEFGPPEHSSEQDTLEYMCTDFIDGMRKCLKDAGIAKIDANQEDNENTCLVAYRGRLFCVCSDYAITESLCGIEGTGCGRSYAIGAVAALENMPVEDRLRRALEIAEEFSNGVRAPFLIERLARNGGDM